MAANERSEVIVPTGAAGPSIQDSMAERERTLRDRTRELLDADDVEGAARLLVENVPAHRPSLRDELNATTQEAAHVTAQARRGELTAAQRAAHRRRLVAVLLSVASDLDLAGSAQAVASVVVARGAGTRQPARTSVFLSYNHADSGAAQDVRRRLVESGVEVRVDASDMAPGESIDAFITRSVQATGCTLCLISRESLLSGWVAHESLLALAARRLDGERRFVAGHLDDCILDEGFRLEATTIVDRRIRELRERMTEQLNRGLDTQDLGEQHTRLLRLRDQLGILLREMRGSLGLDLRLAAREASLARFVSALQPATRRP